MTSQLGAGFSARSGRLRKFNKFFTPISDVDGVVLCDIQQVMVESSQKVSPAAEEKNNSGLRELIAGPRFVNDAYLNKQTTAESSTSPPIKDGVMWSKHFRSSLGLSD